MSYMLQTSRLTKSIGGKELVNGVDMHVKRGEIYGFLGPNGAGKTTVMKMIMNLWKPTEGEIELFGKPLTPQSYEVLRRIGSVAKALEMLDLTEAAKKPVKKYSLGMKERLGIARAILCKPELLILDEPTNGLDPAGMKQIRELLRMLCAEQGTTILVSSHILSEIENMADTIGVIHQGRMKKEISLKEIEEMSLAYIELTVSNQERAAYVLTEKLGLTNFRALDGGAIRIYDNRVTTEELAKTLALNEVAVTALGKKAETLEDYFLKLTGGGNYVKTD